MSQETEDIWYRKLVDKRVGKYTLIRFLGAGRIGYVYLAQHQDLPECKRAIKLTFDLKDGWEVELKKVVALALVDSVVHLHELGPEMINFNNTSRLAQFTVWDYIHPGENLKEYLVRVKSIPTSFLIAVVERILHVLHACHAEGVHRHGDLHSGNILIGAQSSSKLDDMLCPREPIYISDFGYGATGGAKIPKDDYEGLASIINEMLPYVDRMKANATDRQILDMIRHSLGKFFREPSGPERQPPKELLGILNEIKRTARSEGQHMNRALDREAVLDSSLDQTPRVGQFQVSEMIGDHWEWWKRLFVAAVPARSKILTLDIPTVVTGPRGCGKTMLFRRLSERLVVECGEVPELGAGRRFVALYVNANDFADAFAHFPNQPDSKDEARLTCYANLCVLADLLSVQYARAGQPDGRASEALLKLTQRLLVPETFTALAEGEDRLERYRSFLEQIKWNFLSEFSNSLFPGYDQMSHHRWLPWFFEQARVFCPWIADRNVILFIDDYSTPRVSPSMQRILNRLFLQRSPYFLAKLATEASTTFISEDSSGKNLEDGDDYQLVDMGEESLFLPEAERLAFLNAVFSPRLQSDIRIPRGHFSLQSLLDRQQISKTEFARRLRGLTQETVDTAGSQRRGRSRPRVYYSGEDVFSSLWSGDTRTMIQLITDVIDQASEASPSSTSGAEIKLPIRPDLQDQVFRNRGGEWLSAHIRNQPTDNDQVKSELELMCQVDPTFKLCGEYGEHLKAVVEAFVAAARNLLLGPTYRIGETREVPRMAFRLEIDDDFRIEGLAREIYRDLVRYGLFIRDSRGKSIRGTFVPRLYLRRLLLPYSALALSKRDSVHLTCKDFMLLLLKPDKFKLGYSPRTSSHDDLSRQGELPFTEWITEQPDIIYDDLGEKEEQVEDAENITGGEDEEKL